MSKIEAALEEGGDIAIRYSREPHIRALVQLIPMGVGGAIDTYLAAKVENIRQDRAREFFDELARGDIQLSEDLIGSDDFLHCFFITTAAALRSRRKEKIRRFARLLKASTKKDGPKSTDDFEEMSLVLDALTETEWQALLILDTFSSVERSATENTLQWSTKFWADFRKEIERKLLVPSDEFTSFMAAIARTGLYEILTGGFMDYEGGVGFLTPRFFRLKSYVSAE